ncbi:uncharacterized protein LOC113562962 [Ooceraea biroi]|uniref:uncharacterized protein LOC113562962 n=1 Tax=Ooceraea biroi TaxID=2015173 RepID=UPI000F08780C|nr:uncharacterized protein LOC113562962 [Ooceraea biroi]
MQAEDMRLYAVVLLTWAAIVTASPESNISNSSGEEAVDHTESHDSPARKIVQPYVTGIEARSSGQTGTEDHSNDVANVGLSGSAAVRSGERGSSDATTTDSSPAPAVYVTPFTGTASDAYPFGEHLDLRDSGYTVPDDVLVVENAGSFGQRVRQGHLDDQKAARNIDDRQDDDYAYRKSFSSTVSFLEDRGDRERPYAFTTRKPLVLKEEHNLADDSSSTESKAIEFEAFTRNFDKVSGIASTTEARPLDKKNTASTEEESEILPQPQARLSRRYNGTANENAKFPESSEKTKSVVRTSTSVEISPSLQPGRFSGPIVVPELPDEEIRDVVVDYLDDDNLDASRIKFGRNEKKNLEIGARGSRLAASKGITMSSIMLKPLQVGITLVNADQAALDNEQSAATDTDYVQDDLQRLAIADGGPAEYKGNQSRDSYKDESFQRVKEEKPVEAVTQKVLDNSVEIQKSIEIFHTAPVHEIHYPVEYVQQTSNLGVIESNSIGNAQRWKQAHGQDERSELQSNYDVYQGNDQVEKNVIKAHASTLSQRYNRHEYDTSENKPTSSVLIAEFSSNTQQMPAEDVGSQPFKYNDVQPVLLLPSQSGDALRDQSDPQHSFNGDSDVPPRAKPIGSPASQEVANKYVKTYVPGTYRPQQSQSGQLIDHQHPLRSSETRRPETQQQLLLKIIPNGSAGDGGFLVPLPRPYPIEKIVEKTVHVPHPVEVEKVIEKTVQVPVAVPVAQPYPVHVMPERQIRVQHLYPVHVERRAPYTLVQRPLPQSSYSLHMRLPVAYSTTHTAEKATEKPIVTSGVAPRLPRPYRVDVERQPSINSGSVDITYRQKSNAESILENLVPRGTGEAAARPSEVNASRFHHGTPGYGQSLAAYNYVNTPHYPDVRTLMILPRGYAATSRPHAVPSLYTVPVAVRRQIAYNLLEKDGATKGDEYLGPAPLSHKNIPRSKTRSPQYPANSIAAQSQSQSATTTGVLRKSRQPEARYPGSFRQSKMEYGFKPPMVPSVQYDESTATKVEN